MWSLEKGLTKCRFNHAYLRRCSLQSSKRTPIINHQTGTDDI